MRSVRRQDDVTLPPGEPVLDAAPLAGRWINTNSASNGIAELLVEVPDNLAVLKPASRRDGDWRVWGEAPIGRLHGSDVRATAAAAFTAEIKVGACDIVLQGNVNLGLLVLASFNRRRDDAGRATADYFGREFYRRGDLAGVVTGPLWREGDAPVGADDPRQPEAPPPSMPFDRRELVGAWHNTNRNSTGIARIAITTDGDGLALDVTGVGHEAPIAWPRLTADPFALDSGSAKAKAFSARLAIDGVTVDLQANIKQGVLVVASFTSFNDGSGRAGYFHREFYFRD
jgi:hypothetical protein